MVYHAAEAAVNNLFLIPDEQEANILAPRFGAVSGGTDTMRTRSNAVRAPR
jgi:hypothetical protein